MERGGAALGAAHDHVFVGGTGRDSEWLGTPFTATNPTLWSDFARGRLFITVQIEVKASSRGGYADTSRDDTSVECVYRLYSR